LGTRLGYRVVYGACWLVGLLPSWILYHPVADAIYFILYRVARYRLRVVRENLATSFPEKRAAELRDIERGFYHNLSEFFVDAIDLASISAGEMMRRVGWPEDNRAEVLRVNDGRNWIVLMAHYGSWELMSTFGLWPGATTMVSAYRPLSNKVFDLYYKKIRNRLPRVGSVPSSEMLRYYVANRETARPFGIALVADQNPSLDAQSRWVRFLNHPTVFFHGGEKIARKFAIPIYYMHVRKMGRGRYEQTFELIWDGVSPTVDYAITGRYAQLLEETIRREPALWLWSHRRWKRLPEGDDAIKYREQYGDN
jgi:KDO2-lipid IV(A) lauroyltransferase